MSWINKKYEDPKGFHVLNLIFFIGINTFIVLNTSNLYFRISGLIISIIPFLIPLFSKKESSIFSFQFLYLWVLSIGIITSALPLYITETPPTVDDVLKKVPSFFISVFIMILSYFISRILTGQESVLKSINEEISPTLKKTAGKIETLPNVVEQINGQTKEFLKQTDKLSELRNALLKQFDINIIQKNYMENIGNHKNYALLNNFQYIWNTHTESMFKIINKALKDENESTPCVLSILFTNYLNYSFNKVEETKLSFSTTFANYANTVREIVESLKAERGYSFFTLLILSPTRFFNLKGAYSDTNWIHYIDYNRTQIRNETNYSFKRYFLTCQESASCNNKRCRENVVLPQEFNRELGEKFIYYENDSPKVMTKHELQEKEKKLTDILTKIIPKKREMSVSSPYNEIPETAQGFHIISQEEYNLLKESDKKNYMKLYNAILSYHQDNKFFTKELPSAICNVPQLPLDIFAIKKNEEWVFALGTIGTDIISEHIELSIYFSGMEHWDTMKERLSSFFDKPTTEINEDFTY